jgi:uncharacterized protein YkwD
MFPRLRGAWGPSRRVAFAVVPAAFGALLFLAGDRPSTGTARLEATQATAPAAGGTTTALPPADQALAPVAEGPPATLGILEQAVAAALASDAQVATEAPAATAAATGAPGFGPATPAGTGAATSESAAAPRAESGDSSPPPGASTPTTATTSPPATTTTTTAPPPAGPRRLPSVEADVVPLTNADRTANGLRALSRNGCLDAAASRYAEQMAGTGVLAHHPGASAAVRDCRPNSAWGDNVGTSQPCSAGVLEEKWMASPTHRRNILTGEFAYIGVGAWTDADGACWVQVLFSS